MFFWACPYEWQTRLRKTIAKDRRFTLADEPPAPSERSERGAFGRRDGGVKYMFLPLRGGLCRDGVLRSGGGTKRRRW